MDAEQGQSSYFARGEQSFYAEKRTRNDIGWTIAYCLWAALTVFWGIAAFTHTVSHRGRPVAHGLGRVVEEAAPADLIPLLMEEPFNM